MVCLSRAPALVHASLLDAAMHARQSVSSLHVTEALADGTLDTGSASMMRWKEILPAQMLLNVHSALAPSSLQTGPWHAVACLKFTLVCASSTLSCLNPYNLLLLPAHSAATWGMMEQRERLILTVVLMLQLLLT